MAGKNDNTWGLYIFRALLSSGLIPLKKNKTAAE